MNITIKKIFTITSLCLLLSACGSDNETTVQADPFQAIETYLSDNPLAVNSLTMSGMWILVTQENQTIVIDNATEATEHHNFTTYRVVQLKESGAGTVTYDMCAGTSPFSNHVFATGLSSTSFTMPTNSGNGNNDFFTVNHTLPATIVNNQVIDLGEFIATGNNDIKYKVKAYKFRDDVTAKIGSVVTSAGNNDVHCLMYQEGERTPIISTGGSILDFHKFDIFNNSGALSLRTTTEQSTPKTTDLYVAVDNASYEENKTATFNFSSASFPFYSGDFSLNDLNDKGLLNGSFTVDLK